MQNTTIFAGGYGSGKSELALNCALERSNTSSTVVLADLDLVNPYFVSRSLKPILEEVGVRLVAPSKELYMGDVPSVPAEIIGLVRQKSDLVIDLAGDEIGALVLGYLRNYLSHEDLEFFFVLNPYRPFARDLESIREVKEYLERAAGIKFTGIVSNPNLVEETDLEVIRAGHQKVELYAHCLGLPLRYLAVTPDFYKPLVAKYGNMVKKIELHLRPDWL